MEPILIHGYNTIQDIPYNQGIPILKDKGLQVLSFKDLMHDVVEAHESKDYNKRDFLLKHNIHTSTACPHFNRTFGILHDNESLLNLNENTPLINKCLPKTIEQYKQLIKENKDYFLNIDDLIIDKDLTEQEALESKGLFLLSERNKELHKNFVKIRYSLNPKESKLIGIYVPNDQENPEIRAWALRYFDCGISYADAWYILGDECSLLGIPKKNLEQKISN